MNKIFEETVSTCCQAPVRTQRFGDWDEVLTTCTQCGHECGTEDAE